MLYIQYSRPLRAATHGNEDPLLCVKELPRYLVPALAHHVPAVGTKLEEGAGADGELVDGSGDGDACRVEFSRVEE